MSEIKLILAGTPPGDNTSLVDNAAETQLHDATCCPSIAIASLQEDTTQIDMYSMQIDLHDSTSIISYGNSQQKKLKNFTGDTLKNVAGRSLEEIGVLLLSMMDQVRSLDNVLPKSKILQVVRPGLTPATLRAKYDKTAKELERLQKQLEGWYMTLLVDIETLRELYQQVLVCHKELSTKILAGKQKLQQVRTGDLAALQQKATATRTPEDALFYNDLKQKCENFEKRLHDLELTKTLYAQTALQIQLAIDTDEQLTIQIQSGIAHAIAIWQQNVTIAISQFETVALNESNAELVSAISKVLDLQSTEQKRRMAAMQ